MADSDHKGIGRLVNWLHRAEDLILSILLILVLGLAFGQIVLRNVLGTSIVWADVLVRIMVLWLGMLGAMAAARHNKHISIDLISRQLSPKRQLAVECIVSLFASLACAVAAYYSLIFVISEFQAGEIAFAWVPAWLCASILPASFGLIALRYFIQGMTAAFRPQRSGQP